MNEPAPSPFDENGVQYAWDATSISLADTCLRKYYYVMIEGWEPLTRNFHIKFGGHFADALERFYKFRADGATLDEALDEVVRLALIDTWDHKLKDGERVPGTGGPWISPDPAKTRENLIRTIVWYVDQFADEDIKVHILSDGKAAVEHSFRLPVDNGIVLCGHIDRLVDYSHDQFIMDQKTTGRTITPMFFEQFNPNNQMQCYTFCGRIMYHLPVKGVIIDAAQIAQGFSRFARGFVSFTEDQLEEWYRDALYTINLAQEATRRGEFHMNRTKCQTTIDHFPMRRSSCRDYGGCEFAGVCSKAPQVREKFLKADFTKTRKWNPLEQR